MATNSSLQALDAAETGVSHEPRVGRLRGGLQRLREDIQTIYVKDPAARSVLEVLTCYPGLHANWMHRIAHALWKRNHLTLARIVSHISRFLTGIEIHPGAKIGRRFFIDHGSGVVIGETAEIGDDVLMYTGVVLGGTTSERVKRHPSIGNSVVIGSHAIILGNIAVGNGAKVGSGSVIVEAVPPGATVVGVPGHVIRINGRRLEKKPQDLLDHARLPDPVVETLKCLVDRIEVLEKQLRHLTQTTPVDWQEPVPVECTLLLDASKEQNP